MRLIILSKQAVLTAILCLSPTDRHNLVGLIVAETNDTISIMVEA